MRAAQWAWASWSCRSESGSDVVPGNGRPEGLPSFPLISRPESEGTSCSFEGDKLSPKASVKDPEACWGNAPTKAGTQLPLSSRAWPARGRASKLTAVCETPHPSFASRSWVYATACSGPLRARPLPVTPPRGPVRGCGRTRRGLAQRAPPRPPRGGNRQPRLALTSDRLPAPTAVSERTRISLDLE